MIHRLWNKLNQQIKAHITNSNTFTPTDLAATSLFSITLFFRNLIPPTLYVSLPLLSPHQERIQSSSFSSRIHAQAHPRCGSGWAYARGRVDNRPLPTSSSPQGEQIQLSPSSSWMVTVFSRKRSGGGPLWSVQGRADFYSWFSEMGTQLTFLLLFINYVVAEAVYMSSFGNSIWQYV